MKLEYKYFSGTGILNIYVNNDSVVSFYNTKNFANHYFKNKVVINISK